MLNDQDRVHAENLLTILNKAEFNKLPTHEVILMSRSINWLARLLEKPKDNEIKPKKVKTGVRNTTK